MIVLQPNTWELICVWRTTRTGARPRVDRWQVLAVEFGDWRTHEEFGQSASVESVVISDGHRLEMRKLRVRSDAMRLSLEPSGVQTDDRAIRFAGYQCLSKDAAFQAHSWRGKKVCQRCGEAKR